MTTMITLRRRFAVAVAGVATAAATTVTLAPAPANAADVYGAIAYSGNGSWGRSWTTQPGRLPKPPPSSRVATPTARCSPVSPPAAPSPPTIGAYQGGVGPTLAAAMKDALTKLGGGYIDTWACN